MNNPDRAQGLPLSTITAQGGVRASFRIVGHPGVGRKRSMGRSLPLSPFTSIGSLTREDATLPVGTGSVPCREGSAGARADTGTQMVADFHQRMPKRTRSLTLGALIALGHYRTRPPV